ncbi:MAG: hypothetical protein IM600_15790 [Bacteroidetes bacterium]|nr:hypothetical protein [Bacteroidota bacterium]MCA6444890.1 hypothetical protein [Bacteroidota bacterium]
MTNSIKIIFFVLLLTVSCKQSADKTGTEESEILANVGDQKLTKTQFLDAAIKTLNSSDSAEMAKQQLNAWLTEAIFYEEAKSKLLEEEVDIESQVNDYRKELVNHIYQTKLIEANLDTNVSAGEIEAYYNNHLDNFILKDNIVKVNYYKIPLKAQGLEKMKRLLNATSEKDKLQLANLALQYAENFFNSDSTWLYLEDIKKEIPNLREQPDLVLNKGRVMEFNDDFYFYYLKIKDEKIRNSPSPLSFERQNIKSFIINKRKTDLINQYKKQLFENYLSKNKLK